MQNGERDVFTEFGEQDAFAEFEEPDVFAEFGMGAPPPIPEGIGTESLRDRYSMWGHMRPVFWALGKLDKPSNALQVGLYDLMNQRYKIWGQAEKGLKFNRRRALDIMRLLDPEMYKGAFAAGFQKGWRYDDEKSWRDVRRTLYETPEQQEKIDMWVLRHWGLFGTALLTTDESLSELATELFIDALLVAPLYATALKGVRKSPTLAKALYRIKPGAEYTEQLRFFDKPLRLYDAPPNFVYMPGGKLVPKQVVLSGYEEWINHLLKQHYDPKRYVELDDIMLDSLMREAPEDMPIAISKAKGIYGFKKTYPGDVFLHQRRTVTSAGRAITEEAVTDRLIKMRGKVRGMSDDLHRLQVKTAEVESTMRNLERTITITPESYGVVREKAALFQRLGDANITHELLQEQQLRLTDKLYKAKGELKFLEIGKRIPDYGATSRAIRTKYIDDFIGAAVEPGKVKKNITEIIKQITFGKTDDIFDLSDEQFLTLFDHVDAMRRSPAAYTSLPKALQPVLGQPHNWATPAWQVLRRMNAEQVWDFVYDAYITRQRYVNLVMAQWDEHLADIGKDKNTMRRVFLYADNQLGRYHDANLLAGISGERVAMEQAAGDFIHKIAEELAERAIAQGKIGVPGKPAVVKQYITHLFEKRFADAGDDAYKVADIMGMYNRRAHTKININEFKIRLGKQDDLIENADTAIRAFVGHETYVTGMEPAFDQANLMAKMTGNTELQAYVTDWINYSCRGMQTNLEVRLEPSFKWIARNVLERGTSWLPKRMQFKAQERATKQIFMGMRRASYVGAMSFRGVTAFRNSLQSLHNASMYGYTAYANGMKGLFTKGGRSCLKHCRVKIGRMPLESMDITQLSKIERAGMKGFRLVDEWPNVSNAFLTGLYYHVKRDPIALAVVKKHGKFSKIGTPRFWDAVSRTLDAGDLKKIVKWCDDGAALTQYLYIPPAAPRYMWGAPGKFAWQFSTWPANYFTSYLPELIKMTATGKAPWGKLSFMERQALTRHLVQIGSLVYIGKQAGVDLTKIAYPQPSTSPGVNVTTGSVQFLLGLGELAVGKGDRSLKEGWRKIRNASLLLGFYKGVVPYPAPLVAKDIASIAMGEKEFWEFFIPAKKEKEKAKKPISFTLPSLGEEFFKRER